MYTERCDPISGIADALKLVARRVRTDQPFIDPWIFGDFSESGVRLKNGPDSCVTARPQGVRPVKLSSYVEGSAFRLFRILGFRRCLVLRRGCRTLCVPGGGLLVITHMSMFVIPLLFLLG
jgi:hypothetical protein